MAIAFDAATQGSSGGSPASQSYSHTCTGSNGILYVHIYTEKALAADAVTGVTYNSVAMTRVDTEPASSGGNGRSYLYRLVGPATGSNTVAISYAAVTLFAVSVATSYTGAKQSGGVFVSGVASASPSTTVTIVPNSANNWIVMAVGADGNAPTATNAAVLRQAGSNVAITAFDTNAAVTGSTIVGATSNASVYAVAESFEPLVASGPTNVKTWDGITQSTGIKTYLGVALASTKSVNGIT